MGQRFLACIISLSWIINSICAISSPLRPYTTYRYSTSIHLDVADLWWTIDEPQKEITFELHVKTTGWIALGISPAGGMTGADIGLGWIDRSGRLSFEDRYAAGFMEPVADNTTQDWFGLQGREENGWTAIQFKRRLDTCDTMDVSIKSGTNILILAYGLEDPQMIDGKAKITYHGDRRYSRIIPLQSYGNPPPESKFDGLDYFDFQLNKYVLPANDTTYHCKVYKAPTNFSQRRHAIAHRTMIEKGNQDIVHHLLMYECNPTAVFDDNNLPNGLCDEIYPVLTSCTSNIASGWAVGGDDIVEFPPIAGYPVGGDFEIKYYMVQMHYDNPRRMSNRTDSSGIRFYLGRELRQYDLGYLSLGAEASVFGISIPPRVDRFIIDSYCTANMTKKIPPAGITVVSAFPHTHLQGRSLWTKIIRNKTAVRYLFNAEAYDFNYQFENKIPEPIKLYPGDELATRCIYSTTNKDVITLGGESTRDEMCLHMFTYYPRMNNMYMCMTQNPLEGWVTVANSSVTTWSYETTKQWLLDQKWTPESARRWQEFYNNAPRLAYAGRAGAFEIERLPKLPDYKDLPAEECKRAGPDNTTTAPNNLVTSTTRATNAVTAIHPNSLIFLTLISSLIAFFQ